MTEQDGPVVTGTPPAESPAVAAGPPVVGIGASAGGLRALLDFLAAVPADCGLAFVVVVHLSPDHESHLADLLQPRSALPVLQVCGAVRIERNRVYVIPPGCNLAAVDSHLRLTPLERNRVERAPVDHFLRTLAETHDGHSVGVILSGTGGDGAQGIRCIRDCGGMVLAQDPEEAEYDAMPRSAIDTGLVDLVLPAAEMPRHILEFARTEPAVPKPGNPHAEAPEQLRLLEAVLNQVRVCTGHDFLGYKRSTVARRLARRMQVLRVERMEAYLELVRSQPQEAAALVDDLLINVTRFFRDPEVFRKLEEEVVPALFEGRNDGDEVRVWSVGCATGEEAYSLGMLLCEHAARLDDPPRIRVFASDLHERSLRHARDGLFPETIAADIPAERLARFFRAEAGGYRVRKELRDSVTFAAHNLLRDPPFSGIDLVTCRNLLIYLQRDVQKRVIKLFHYALSDGGYLLVGTAETLERSPQFRLESSEHHLYRRRTLQPGERRVPTLPARGRGGWTPSDPSVHADRPGYGGFHARMVERYAPPSLMIDANGDVLHVSERAGRYLRHPAGVPTSALLKVVREELRAELRGTLHVVRERGRARPSPPIPIRIDGQLRHVVLRVSPVGENDLDGFVLIIFEEVEAPGGSPDRTGPADGETVRALEQELELTRSRLQTVLEEFETGQEEMRASNEELQSSNEELRSTMEELETSKEELQSINEELHTLNSEHVQKVDELSHLSSDLQNLLHATGLATLFLDRGLRIVRFTPRIGELFNIRPSDRGRPLAHLTHRLGYGGLLDDAQGVLETLLPVEREIESEDGGWHLVRMNPYRSVDDRIDGVVITFVDVTALRRSEAAVRERDARYRLLLESVDQGYMLAEVLYDGDTPDDALCLEANPAAVRILGGNPAGRRLSELDRSVTARWVELSARVLGGGAGAGERLEAFAEPLDAWLDFYIVKAGASDSRQIAVIFSDVTERRRTQQALQASEERLRAAIEAADLGTWDLDLSTGTSVSRSARHDAIFGYAEPQGEWGWQTALRHVLPEDRPVLEAAFARAMEAGVLACEVRVRRPDGSIRWIAPLGRAYPDPAAGPAERLVGVVTDITERKHAEAVLVQAAAANAFRVALTDALRASSDPLEVGAEACRALGRHLGASRVIFMDVSPDGEHGIIHRDYCDGVPSMAGSFQLRDAGSPVIAALRASQVVAMSDLAAEPGMSPRDIEAQRSTRVAAKVAVPLREDGRLVAILGVHQAVPREWTGDEVALIVETAERAWAAVRRARAETALRELNDSLERRVVERTAELARLNAMLGEEIREREHAEQARSTLLRQLATAEEDERRRISRELHDEMGQLLTGLLLGLRSHAKNMANGGGSGAGADAPRIDELIRLADRIAREMQGLALQLRPPALDNVGLKLALQSHVEEWSARNGIAADVHISGFDGARLPAEVETTIYRVVQEGLTNVLKHAEATSISLLLERRDSHVMVILEDDGNGFGVDEVLASPEQSLRLGLRGMRERLALLGGSLEIESVPGESTTIFARIPEPASQGTPP
jgi:two-component system, chemotaxis family, CheB/CheR fusion protein